ncbi:nuclear body protein SP140-like protein [Ornithorhynchus anatinus]|uniref:nuclear body protein SP140-like protein n=1 Tax=Ornithorhynchus anatinus TaxID=9258 RepID=UPI0004545046|nr:nuclear body protein SP140-like protein [Ornithorhynchus anatinus]XP_028925362.1 nuclear body protein SP140-like protein [Ornithorhynchus anatinus]
MERTSDEYLLTKFRKKKVEISFAITEFYPFLYELKDYRIISEEMFERCRAQEEPIAPVIYEVLEKLEAILNQKVLKVLFSKSNLQNYPLLQQIYRSFADVLEDGSSEEESDFTNTSRSENAAVPSSETADTTNGSDFQSSGERGKSEGNLGGPKKEQGRRNYKGQNVDFSASELPVTCGEAKGILFKKKMDGTLRKCIKDSDGEWLTPREFEVKGDRACFKNWKKSIYCYGRTLNYLLEKRYLPKPSKTSNSNRKSYRNQKNFGFADSHQPRNAQEDEEEEDGENDSDEFNSRVIRCPVCDKLCKSMAGLVSHSRVHHTWFQ